MISELHKSQFCLSSALCGGSGEHIEQEQSKIPALGSKAILRNNSSFKA